MELPRPHCLQVDLPHSYVLSCAPAVCMLPDAWHFTSTSAQPNQWNSAAHLYLCLQPLSQASSSSLICSGASHLTAEEHGSNPVPLGPTCFPFEQRYSTC